MTVPALPLALRNQIADELVRARGELEQIGESLCVDPAITARHMGALQAFDRIGQHLLGLAAVLHAEDATAAVFETPLERLRHRLEMALR
jgi:hypothetical protein